MVSLAMESFAVYCLFVIAIAAAQDRKYQFDASFLSEYKLEELSRSIKCTNCVRNQPAV